MRIYIYKTLEGQILLSTVGDETSIDGFSVILLGYTEMSMTRLEPNPL